MRKLDFCSQGVLAAFAMLACSLSLGSCGGTLDAGHNINDMIAECQVTREECTSGFSALNVCKGIPVPVTFPATDCFRSKDQNGELFACGKFCNQPNNNSPNAPQLNTKPNRLWDMNNAGEGCSTQRLSVRAALPGECAEVAVNTTTPGASASVMCERSGYECLTTAQSGNYTICTSRASQTVESGTKCFDPLALGGAEQACINNFMTANNNQLQMPRVRISNVTLDDTVNCPQTAASGPTTAYGISTGPLGTAVHGSDIFALNATGGFLKFSGTCDASGEFCPFSQLIDMRVTVSDFVVSGVPLQNIEARLTRPAPIVVTNGVRKIPKANFQLELIATVLGGTGSMVAFASSDVILAVNGQTASFSFTATLSGAISGLDGVPLTVTANVSASVNNPGAACAGLSPIQALMGFEQLFWTSTQAQLSLSPSLHTQGCYGLNVAGGGYMTIDSAPFGTPLTGVTSTLKLDAYVPPAQPNPYWFGAIQMYASCPSAGVNNAYLGQVELTGKPTGAFSTLSYGVPANVRAALQGTHNDCFFSVAVNVNAAPTPVVLDNLRFTP